MPISIPDYIIEAMNLLSSHSKRGFIVGGCVRDSVMGTVPHDWDMTTDALPGEIKSIFSEYRTVDTGIKHGTVLAVLDSHPVEITTFRVDGEYTDCRHPDSVTFTRDIKDDLARRDFTINAMAYSEATGLVDIFGGADDIENKLIRCVGDPDERFGEDALRIMRALRFSSTLGFTVEAKTKQAIFRNADLLRNIARERISSELLKLLCGKNVLSVMEEYREIFGVIIPELKCEFGFEQHGRKHAYTVWGHTCHTVANIENDETLRLTMLLHDIGKPVTHKLNANGDSTFKNHAAEGGKLAAEVLKTLKLSRKMTDTVTYLVTHHDMDVPDSRKEVKRYLNMMGEEKFLMLMKIRTADRSALSESFRDISAQTDYAYSQFYDIIDKKEPYTLSALAVNGRDLAALGITGEATKTALDKCLEAVICDPSLNTKEKLTAYIKENRNEN